MIFCSKCKFLYSLYSTTCGSNGIFSRRLDFSLYNVLPKQRINSIEVKVIMEISFIFLARVVAKLKMSKEKFVAKNFADVATKIISLKGSLKTTYFSCGFKEGSFDEIGLKAYLARWTNRPSEEDHVWLWPGRNNKI